MTQTRRSYLKLITAGLGSTLLPRLALAESPSTETTSDAGVATTDAPVTHEVLMYTKHPDDKKIRNVFVPDLLHVNPGDTVVFKSVEKGHNSKVDAKMMPDGGDTWDGKISKDVEVTFSMEGAYGYYCTPHRSLGMGGLILVGDASGNYEAVKSAKQKGKAKKVYADIFARADALLAAHG
jgi:pseudoazurin